MFFYHISPFNPPPNWDILKDMKLPGSQILADEKIIYEDGKWKI